MGLGLIMVYSASFVLASEKYGDGLFYLRRQFIFVLLALALLFFSSRIDYLYYRKFFPLLFLGTVALLGLVFVPGIGHRVGGAWRWINTPFGFRIEPSELAKLMSAIIFAYLLTINKKANQSLIRFLFYSIVYCGLPIFLMLKQPDFGSCVIFFLVGFALLFSFGLRWSYIIATLITLIPIFYLLVMRVDYRRNRMLAFLNPWSDPTHSGFQVIQSLLGVHAGGIWGTGIGKGQAKLFFLPEAHTDFILAVLAEETGFVGIALVLSMFAWIVFRGLQIGMRCQEPFGKRLAIGLSCLLGFEGLINAGVVTGLLPTKGLTMPLLSYGGSSLLVTALACGIIINIHRRSLKI